MRASAVRPSPTPRKPVRAPRLRRSPTTSRRSRRAGSPTCASIPTRSSGTSLSTQIGGNEHALFETRGCACIRWSADGSQIWTVTETAAAPALHDARSRRQRSGRPRARHPDPQPCTRIRQRRWTPRRVLRVGRDGSDAVRSVDGEDGPHRPPPGDAGARRRPGHRSDRHVRERVAHLLPRRPRGEHGTTASTTPATSTSSRPTATACVSSTPKAQRRRSPGPGSRPTAVGSRSPHGESGTARTATRCSSSTASTARRFRSPRVRRQVGRLLVTERGVDRLRGLGRRRGAHLTDQAGRNGCQGGHPEGSFRRHHDAGLVARWIASPRPARRARVERSLDHRPRGHVRLAGDPQAGGIRHLCLGAGLTGLTERPYPSMGGTSTRYSDRNHRGADSLRSDDPRLATARLRVADRGGARRAVPAGFEGRPAASVPKGLARARCVASPSRRAGAAPTPARDRRRSASTPSAADASSTASRSRSPRAPADGADR